MSLKDVLNSESHARLSRSRSLSVLGVCLDNETWKVLESFAASVPLIRLRSNTSEYPLHETESPGEPPPDISIVDFDRDRRQAALVAENIHSTAPEAAIFAVSTDAQPDLIIQAMRSGCSEYLLKPIGREQLLNAVARVGGRTRERTPSFRAEVLAFTGAKGGCGVTSIVTQLGALIASSLSRRTLVVDLHPEFGDAALYLGVTRHQYHFFELVENTDRLDAELLQSFLTRHSSGLELIPAPEGNETPRRILPGAVARTLEFLRSRYDYILVDVPLGLSDVNLELIRHCDYLYMVTIAEVSALRNVAGQFSYLLQKEIPEERLRIVLNRHQKRSLISDSDIEKTLGREIFWKVPNGYAHVVKAINGGDPIANLTSSDVARSLHDFALGIGAKPAESGKKKEGGFRFRAGKT